MRILFIPRLLLTFGGCTHSNFAWHRPALYLYDSKTLTDRNRQQYLADQSHQQQNFPYLSPYAYTIFDW